MGAHLITGYAGKEHITARDQGAYNAGTIGNGKYVLETGNEFKYEIVSNNLIKIRDGDLINQGRHMNIAVNDYAEVQIDNGIQALKRNDLIVMRYTKNVETDIEKAEIVLIKGISGDVAADPEYLSGNILAGAAEDDFLLYKVRLNGLNIEGVDKLFSTIPSFLNFLTSVVEELDSHNHDARYYTETESNNLFVRKANISSSNAIVATGTYALDAREKNPDLPGTLAHSIQLIDASIPIWDCGSKTIDAFAGEPTTAYVAFNKIFAVPPAVVITPVSAVPGTQILGFSTNNITKSGFEIVVTRKTSGALGVRWIAIGG